MKLNAKEVALLLLYAFLTFWAIEGISFLNKIIFASTGLEAEEFEKQCTAESGYVERYIGIDYCLVQEND